MLDFNKVEYCSGCGGCANVCPVSAIQMHRDAEGFYRPVICTETCISCGKCEKVCPHLNLSEKGHTYGAWLYASKDEDAKRRSSSGAAFFELAKGMLQENGYICGCVWDEKLNAVHLVGNTPETLKRMQGSKYVQSDAGLCYREILELLKSGKRILFSGTPCQAVAMHNLVMACQNGEYRNQLITVAVICHGVASPAVWDSFQQWTAGKHGSPLKTVNFRDKSQEGYKKSYCRYEYQSGEVTYVPTYLPSSKYIEATLVYNLAIQCSCAHCDCKGIQPGIDLLIGDWYAEHTGEGSMGTSCIAAFSQRGMEYAQKQLAGLRVFEYNTILEHNGFMEKSVTLSPNRTAFFAKISDTTFWDRVESLYPSKYRLKKLLVKTGVYHLIKKLTG